MKTYEVELFANDKSLGCYEVKANSPEQARELAWGLCETTFYAKVSMPKEKGN